VAKTKKKSSVFEKYERAQLVSDLWGALRIAGIAAAIFAAIFYFVPEPTDQPFWKLARDIVLTSFGQVAVLTLPVIFFQRTNIARVVTQSLKLSLGSETEMFGNLSPEMRADFVGANLKATLGDLTGEAVFGSVVSPLMDSKKTTYRKDFRYQVKALDAPPAKPAPQQKGLQDLIDALHDTRTYFWLNQCLQYDLRKATDDELKPYGGPFELWFAFDEKTLDKAMRQDEVFFREVLKLGDADQQRLTALKPDELKAFPLTVLGLKVEARSSGQDLPCKFDVTIDPGASPMLRIKIREIKGPTDHTGLRITFNMPQLNDVTRFVVVLPQPTEKPEIEFTRSRGMKNLEPVRFLSRLQDDAIVETVDGNIVGADNPPPPDPVQFNMKINSWTFPTSGVMFVWEKR
jgi:hypothetical protein